MLNKGCIGYLAYVGNRNNAKLAQNAGGTLVVYEFSNVLLDNLSGLTLEKKVKFNIVNWLLGQPQYPKYHTIWL